MIGPASSLTRESVVPMHVLAAESVKFGSRFSIVGQYVSEASSFVKHIAILKNDGDLRYAERDVLVYHMGPPLVAGDFSATDAGESSSTCTVHLLGEVDLDEDDLEGIETWLAEVEKEERPHSLEKQYVVNPPMVWEKAENEARLYRRFSCVGFVLECYRFVRINLIDDAISENLPEIDLDTLAQVYGPIVQTERRRDKMGITGNGPWRIALAGYIIHAMDRDSLEIRKTPHKPTSSAETNFPKGKR
jgi:hypothetical protein